MDYRDMTIWQLEQEKAKIEAELARRKELAKVAADLRAKGADVPDPE